MKCNIQIKSLACSRFTNQTLNLASKNYPQPYGVLRNVIYEMSFDFVVVVVVDNAVTQQVRKTYSFTASFNRVWNIFFFNFEYITCMYS